MTTQGAKYQLLPDLSPEERAALKEDIRQNGVKVPIEFDENDDILDGHHRFTLFCELVDEGVDLPMFDKITRKFDSEEAKLNHVLSLNLNRRHLDAEQRQQLVITLRRDRGMTMQAIAAAIGKSVATVWRDINDAPEDVQQELKNLTIQTGDGRQMPAAFAQRSFITGSTQVAHAMVQQKGEEQQAAAAAGQAPAPQAATRYAVMVTCKTEGEQAELLDRLIDEGYEVKALVL